uniref:Smoothelin isoform X2 n=1 Tax=Pogona vitticeps TaxID=103695 RepID=A0ABM5F2X0_9SAUR
MSEETLLTMDEGTLRKLLEATLDLAERRRIRSAIRELRRQELERDEEATLASKRFRTERQENKENLLRSRRLEEEEEQQQKALGLLSGKLEAIQDVEELTALLRGASEYEERKLIRAAIRKLRDEEIKAASLAGKTYDHRRDPKETLDSKGQEEKSVDRSVSEVQERAERELIRAQIRELRSQQHGDTKPPDVPDSSLGTFLLLDPAPNRPLSESSSAPESGPDPDSSTEGPEASSRNSDSGPESQPPLKEESVSGQSAPEDGEALRPLEGGSAGETMQEKLEFSNEGEGVSSEREAPSRLSVQESIEKDDVPHVPAKEAETTTSEGGDACVSVPLPSVAPERPASSDAPCAGTASPTPRPKVNADARRDQPFQRTGSSIWERARKFSAEPPSPAGTAVPAPQKAESASRGARILQQPQHLRRPADSPVQAPGGGAGRAFQDGTKQRAGSAFGAVGEPSGRLTGSPAKAVMTAQPPAPASPKEVGGLRGRGQDSQWQGGKLTPARQLVENTKESSSVRSEEPDAQRSTSSRTPLPSRARSPNADPNDAMKTLLTIEIKDGRNQPVRSHIVGMPGNQRAELTLGLRSAPVQITTTSTGSLNQMEAELPEQPKAAEVMSNYTEKEKAQEVHRRSRLSAEELSKIEEEEVLDKMLDQTTDFEERRLIRAAMRELRQRKRDQREKERSQRLQEAKTKAASHTSETTARQKATSADGSAVSTVTKTQRLVQSNDGSKTSRTMMMEASYVKRSENGSTFVQTKSSYTSSSSKKVGSIFEREDESPGRAGSLAALERRQAEKKKELMKAQSLPKTTTSQARKAMIEKMEKEGGSPANPAMSRVAVQRSASFGVPNANSIKQMLLDWCRAKTRGYEHVDIQNFSSSWSDGMAFCALVHNFFPDAFDYAQLSPQDRRHNFELAFSAAETHAECPQLLDVEDMVRMKEPDWKCVYTYIQEFYRCLVQKGLVKTKKS